MSNDAIEHFYEIQFDELNSIGDTVNVSPEDIEIARKVATNFKYDLEDKGFKIVEGDEVTAQGGAQIIPFILENIE